MTKIFTLSNKQSSLESLEERIATLLSFLSNFFRDALELVAFLGHSKVDCKTKIK